MSNRQTGKKRSMHRQIPQDTNCARYLILRINKQRIRRFSSSAWNGSGCNKVLYLSIYYRYLFFCSFFFSLSVYLQLFFSFARSTQKLQCIIYNYQSIPRYLFTHFSFPNIYVASTPPPLFLLLISPAFLTIFLFKISIYQCTEILQWTNTSQVSFQRHVVASFPSAFSSFPSCSLTFFIAF